jgi:hypothetical protein
LDGVAAVDEQRVGRFLALLADQAGDLCQSSIHFPARQVVVRVDVAVEIRRDEQGNVNVAPKSAQGGR